MGIVPKVAPISLGVFFSQIQADAALEAQAREIQIVVSIAGDLSIKADARLLRSGDLQPPSQCAEVQSRELDGRPERRAR